MLSLSCKVCQKSFTVTPEEEQIALSTAPVMAGERYPFPRPDTCGPCRLDHLRLFQNNTNLFKTTCVGSKKEILSEYHPDSWVKTMEYSLWFSDAFYPKAYGRDFDFTRPFFAQFEELLRVVPRLNISINDLENSPYVNAAGFLKDCYLLFNSSNDQRCYYSYGLFNSRDSADATYGFGQELCYESIDSNDCYDCAFIQDAKRCQHSYFLYDCSDCDSCIGCFGLQHKKYWINNEQKTKEEYEAYVAYIKQASWEELRALQEKFEQAFAKYPRRYFTGENTEDVSGNNLFNAKQVHRSYMLVDAENCYDCSNAYQIKDSVAVLQYGEGADHLYYVANVGTQVSTVAFSKLVWRNSANVYYSDMCFSSRHCFGCVGMKFGEYCIFNKQYTKEDYEALVPRIIEHMRSTGEWGQFFPAALSPFAYNESTAMLFAPRSRKEIEQRGYAYRDEQNPDQAFCEDLPSDRIRDTDESITKKVLCSVTSGKPYRIIPQEYAFYLRKQLPIPREHYAERLVRRYSKRPPERLFERSCASCSRPLLSSFEGETVLCEGCHEARL